MNGRKGISPLIASVLSILFGVMMLAIVLTVIQPAFKRAEDSSTITDIFQNLQLLNSGIKEVSSEARGSKRTIPLTVSGGEYRINGTYDWLYAVYEPKSDFKLTGTKGDIKIEHGLEFMDCFNWYVDGSNGTPIWTNTSGEWSVSNLRYLGSNGSAYMSITPRPIENFEFSGKITNISGPTGGQIFVLSTGPENLEAFWAFDNGTGTKVYDWSGNLNNGTLKNGTVTCANGDCPKWNFTDCKSGRCLKFDGMNDYVDSGYTTTLGTNDDFSMEMWIKTNTKASSQVPAGFGSTTSDWNRVQFDIDTNGNLRFYVRDDNGNVNSYRDTSIDLSDNVWHHIVGTWDGSSDTAILYINGDLKGSDSTNTLGTITISHALTIGSLNNNGVKSEYLNGLIDEVKIWGVALTAEEAAAEYELSAKKILESGSHSVSTKMYASLVLSNPAGQTQFDDIKITRKKNELSFIIPYSNVDINGTLRLRKGERLVTISHMGVNTTTNKPIIEIKTG